MVDRTGGDRPRRDLRASVREVADVREVPEVADVREVREVREVRGVRGVRGLPPVTRDPRPPLLHRVTGRQLLAVDLAVAGILVLGALWHLARAAGEGPGARLLAVSLIGAAVAIAVRRRFVVVSLVLMTACLALSAARGGSAVPVPLIVFPVYQVASTRHRGYSLRALVTVDAVLLLATAVGRAEHYAAGGSGFGIALAVAAWFVGDSVRVRRVYVAGLAEQAAQRNREVVERAQRSLVEERLRIARELHDVVAHSLSVIAVQSGVGRHVIDDNPAAAKRALGAVETTSRAALQELRRLLGVLRSEGAGAASLAPAPCLDGLEQLAEQVRAAGVPVDLRVAVPAGRLSPSAELSVYRVVQEALTNVVKHAGPASVRVRVAVRGDLDALVVEIVDDGCGPVPTPYPADDPDSSGHHGIVGMRERVALFGGTLDVGHAPEGGFAVRARLPLAAVSR